MFMLKNGLMIFILHNVPKHVLYTKMANMYTKRFFVYIAFLDSATQLSYIAI